MIGSQYSTLIIQHVGQFHGPRICQEAMDPLNKVKTFLLNIELDISDESQETLRSILVTKSHLK